MTTSYDEVFIGTDLGAICRKNPIEALALPAVYANDPSSDAWLNGLAAKEEIEQKYREGDEWAYREAAETALEATSDAVKGLQRTDLEQYVEQIIGVEEPESEAVEHARELFYQLLGGSEGDGTGQLRLVSETVADYVKDLQDAGVDIHVITDDPDWIAEPVCEHYLDIPSDKVHATTYEVDEDGCFNGKWQMQDKGKTFKEQAGSGDGRQVMIGDSTRDQPMGEQADISVILPSENDRMTHDMRDWVVDKGFRVQTPEEVFESLELLWGPEQDVATPEAA